MTWIKVEDKLPEDGDTILIYGCNRYFKHPYEVALGCYLEPDNQWFANGDKDGDWEVSHWQPLPESPK